MVSEDRLTGNRASGEGTASRRGKRRIAREQKTIDLMIGLYCRDVHGRAGVACAECDDLRRYAAERLRMCPFGPEKPTCVKCPVHCYKPDRREQVRVVMRHSGPRMLLRHPILTLLHLYLDSRQQAPTRPHRRAQPARG